MSRIHKPQEGKKKSKFLSCHREVVSSTEHGWHLAVDVDGNPRPCQTSVGRGWGSNALLRLHSLPL